MPFPSAIPVVSVSPTTTLDPISQPTLFRSPFNGKLLDHDLIQAVVTTTDKIWFAISEGRLRIRAVQGHSTDTVDINYAEKVSPEFLYHGTETRFIESIRNQGLLPGSRQYVHLSQDEQIALAVGQHHGKPVVLRIEASRMHEQGFKFSQAENGVWLTKKVPHPLIKLPV